jgi:hypothetical protein
LTRTDAVGRPKDLKKHPALPKALPPLTSFRQIAANRRNALRSTGPTTTDGKRRSRRNPLRHGLCAETVVDGIEDTEDYRAFEAAIIADYEARTAVERELLLRLALATSGRHSRVHSSTTVRMRKRSVGGAPRRCDRAET